MGWQGGDGDPGVPTRLLQGCSLVQESPSPHIQPQSFQEPYNAAQTGGDDVPRTSLTPVAADAAVPRTGEEGPASPPS